LVYEELRHQRGRGRVFVDGDDDNKHRFTQSEWSRPQNEFGCVPELRNASGDVLATADPEETQNAEIRAGLKAGDSYLTVKSTGVYGWIGQHVVDYRFPLPGKK
jgi:hypothetical protein